MGDEMLPQEHRLSLIFSSIYDDGFDVTVTSTTITRFQTNHDMVSHRL